MKIICFSLLILGFLNLCVSEREAGVKLVVRQDVISDFEKKCYLI